MTVAPTRRCRGTCKGDRAAWESPAVLVRVGRGTMPFCPCCESLLRYDPTSAVEKRPPNLSPDVKADWKRFNDDVCGYDTVLMADLKPAQ